MIQKSMDSIQVFLRIRPLSEEEYAKEKTTASAVKVLSKDTVSVPSQRTEAFSFDFIGTDNCTQDDVFEAVGKCAVERCMQGYNGTIFAYGQTGSGKTFTMQGARDEFASPTDELRGLIPRCFEYLFARIAEEEARSGGKVKYLCRASYIEIYNESIYDLLDPMVHMCALREDIKKGVFVDSITEETVQDPNDAYSVFVRGAQNRRVSATSMNRESSRSHTVLMLVIQSLTQMESGLTEVRESRFNLVDLAGSERQKLANTSGLRLKEAANINKSLSALGKVINALVDIGNGRMRHVNYRDSKLTFLLRDSLGGNSITFIIANVSPALSNDSETVSTLRFAQSAKMIRNKAVVNQDMQGNVPQLQAEIQRLNQELQSLKTMVPTPDQSSNEGTISPGSYAVSSADSTYKQLLSPKSNQKDHQTTQLLLVLALRKLRESERQKVRYAETVFGLKQVLDNHKLQAQQQRFLFKLKQAENDALRRNASPEVIINAENNALREEVVALQGALSANPDAADMLIENLQLREQVLLLQSKDHVIHEMIASDGAAATLEALLRSGASIDNLMSTLPVIPDSEEYESLERKIKQSQHSINDLELQKDRLEFHLHSIEEDWQYVHDGANALLTSTSQEESDRIVERTLDSIVADEPRNTWRAMSSLFLRNARY